MSLLLNALKKVEEGEEKSPESAPASGEAAAPAAGATGEAPAAGAAAPAAATAAPAAGAAAQTTPPPTPAAQPAAPAAAPSVATMDLDSMEEEEEAPKQAAPAAAAAAAAASKPKRERPDAADALKVFGATAAAGGAWKKWAVGAAGIVAVGGGTYGILASEIIPGLDMSIFGGIGQELAINTSGGSGETVRFEDIEDEDLALLPIPVIDVQSEVDFADLRSQDPDIIGDEEYKRQIAIYTGYDIEKEKQRLFEEAGLLETEPSIEELAILAADEEAAEVVEEAEIVTRTADDSRAAKSRLDQLTPSERNIEIAIRGEDGNLIEEVVTETTEVVAEAGVEAPAAVVEEVVTQVAREQVAQAQTQVQVSEDGAKRNALLRQAKNLYNNGKYIEAETIFRDVLRAVPANLDALRGLALVASATGRYQLAAATYIKILGYYPNDPFAITELTNLRAGGNQGDFYETERILKRLLGEEPDSDARIYFALGNLYSGNADWPEAQQAYFEAHSRDPNNADYAYNLAVVFDYLNKPELALRYYNLALGLADGVLVGFNRNQVRQRIQELS